MKPLISDVVVTIALVPIAFNSLPPFCSFLSYIFPDTLQNLSKLLHVFPHFVNRKTDELSSIVKCLNPKNKQCQCQCRCCLHQLQGHQVFRILRRDSLTVIREHFKLKAKQEYREEIQHARSLLIDYLISFLKVTFKVFLSKNSVKSAIEEFSGEKENVMQLVQWIDKGEMDEERIKKCIDVFNVAGEMLAKMMAKLNYRNVYGSLAKKSKEMGDQRRMAECLISLGIKEIFNCICAIGPCDKAIDRARFCLDEADEIQTRLQVNKGNSHAQCLAKLGSCLVRGDEKERGKTMIEDAIHIREASVETPIDHEEEGGENVCYVMLGATYNDKAVALSFENDHREAVNIRKNQVMPIYRERLGDHPFTATILNNLSNNHRDLREFDQAENYARQALDIRLELLADHRDTTKSLFDLGLALKENRKFREAKGCLEQCKTMQEKVVNDKTLVKKTEEELRDVNRLLEMKQVQGVSKVCVLF
ncbi:uncharacterized protein LOC141889970 [Acropora palmata]|uniref:uncharacterized protein LOC141889970 n=1 Tax=Acropora palmata TaxID=6131 RepID=UPI003DA03120